MSEPLPIALRDCAVADTPSYTVAVNCGGVEPGQITVTPSCLIVKPGLSELRFQEQGSDVYFIRYNDKSICFDSAGKNCPTVPKTAASEGGKPSGRELIVDVNQWRQTKIGSCDAVPAGTNETVSGNCMHYALSCLSQDTGTLSLVLAKQPVIVLERPPLLSFHPGWIVGVALPLLLVAVLLRGWWNKRKEAEEDAAPHGFRH